MTTEPAIAGRPWFRAALRAITRLYYPIIGVSHPERIPLGGPVIFVANHPNGMIDPVVVQLAIGRSARFLAKSTFWDNPISRAALESAGALPAFRANEADTTKNEQTFARCRQILHNKGIMALFPEGVSHSTTSLLPLKTGAARIALSAEAENGWSLGLQVIPIGLLYSDKAIFRSTVGAVIGQPIAVRELQGAYMDDPKAAVNALTARISSALGEVVLTADSGELWRGILAVATWTSPDGGADSAARDRRALALAERARRLTAEAPMKLDEAITLTRDFANRMARLGVNDPFAFDQPKAKILSHILPLVLLAPFALLGALLAWVPYRLVRVAANWMASGDAEVVGTLKVIFGTLFLTPTYVFWAALAAWTHPLAGLAMVFIGPLTGLAAVRFEEHVPWDAVRGWLHSQDTRTQISNERQRLSQLIQAALT